MERKINRIIVHCTATVEGKSYDIATIRRWHLWRGFKDIGYHYIIDLKGKVLKGRPDDVIGAHCVGKNHDSIGVCYIGGLDKNELPKDTRTEAQKTALKNLLVELKAKYPQATIHGHNEFAAKACPCFDVKKEYGDI